MSLAHGSQIARDGLVFHYDMSNPQKSWRGAPTTNLMSSSAIDASVLGSYPLLEVLRVGDPDSPSGFAMQLRVTSTSINGASRATMGAATSIPISGTTFVSVVAKSIGSTTTIRPSVYTGGGWFVLLPLDSGSIYLTDQYRRFGLLCSMSTASGGPTPAFSMTNSGPTSDTVTVTRWHSPQCEISTFATPFVNGARTNTQAIIDLTKNNTVTANSLTYAADSTFSFDRLNNPTLATNLPVTALPALSNFTLSTWLNITALPPVAANNGVIFGATYYSGTAIYWRSNGSTFTINGFIRGNDAYRVTASYTLSLNTVHYIVLTNNYSAGTLNLYVNGALFSSVATATQEYVLANAAIAGNVGVNKPQVDGGGSQVYTYFTGIVHSALIYNRALSAEEIAQNFEAARGRYGI